MHRSHLDRDRAADAEEPSQRPPAQAGPSSGILVLTATSDRRVDDLSGIRWSTPSETDPWRAERVTIHSAPTRRCALVPCVPARAVLEATESQALGRREESLCPVAEIRQVIAAKFSNPQSPASDIGTVDRRVITTALGHSQP